MGSEIGRGGLIEAPPPPGPERTAPLAEAGSPELSGTVRWDGTGRDGTGQGRGVRAACGTGVPREPQGRGVRLSVVGALAQSVGAI